MSMVYKYKFLLLLYVAILSACQSKVVESSSTNVVFILADDLGYGDISLFNENGKIPTPHIDALGEEGLVFTDAHTSSSVCTPTRYGILTGRYNWRSTLKSSVLTGKSKALIPRDRTTIASMLKHQGYQTAFIGKWHLGWDWTMKDETDKGGAGWDYVDFEHIDFSRPITLGPNDLGFDYAYGHSGSLDMAPYVYVENGMPTMVPDTFTVDTTRFGWWRKGPTSADFIHEEVTPHLFAKASNFIVESAIDEQPFFLYLALPSPHTPILPTEMWQGKSGLNPYGDFVMEIDNYMGELISMIDSLGISDNTMIVFTSDNGCSPQADFPGLGEKGHDPSYIYRGHKADIYEGGHRVPLVIKWPDRIDAGSRCDKTICMTDFMATLADISNYTLEDNEGEDSYSLLPLMDDPGNNSYLRKATVHHSINGSFAIRQEEWKLILCPGSGGWSNPRPNDQQAMDTLPAFQLYNLSDDPAESVNVIASETDRAKAMKNLLKTYILQGRSTPGMKQPNDSIDHEWHQIHFISE